MSNMRAKFQLNSIQQFGNGKEITGEKLSFSAVAKSGGYPTDGSDEDNTYAKFTPSASCEVHVANPALFGKFIPGQKYYVDFSLAE